MAQEPQRPNLKTEVPGPNTKRLFEQLNSIQVHNLSTFYYTLINIKSKYLLYFAIQFFKHVPITFLKILKHTFVIIDNTKQHTFVSTNNDKHITYKSFGKNPLGKHDCDENNAFSTSTQYYCLGSHKT